MFHKFRIVHEMKSTIWFLKVVHANKNYGPLRRRNGGATKHRETFRLPSDLSAVPPPPGRKQIGRQVEHEDHKKPSKETFLQYVRIVANSLAIFWVVFLWRGSKGRGFF